MDWKRELIKTFLTTYINDDISRHSKSRKFHIEALLFLFKIRKYKVLEYIEIDVIKDSKNKTYITLYHVLCH